VPDDERLGPTRGVELHGQGDDLEEQHGRDDNRGSYRRGPRAGRAGSGGDFQCVALLAADGFETAGHRYALYGGLLTALLAREIAALELELPDVDVRGRWTATQSA
jgi:hypothetical protein